MVGGCVVQDHGVHRPHGLVLTVCCQNVVDRLSSVFRMYFFLSGQKEHLCNKTPGRLFSSRARDSGKPHVCRSRWLEDIFSHLSSLFFSSSVLLRKDNLQEPTSSHYQVIILQIISKSSLLFHELFWQIMSLLSIPSSSLSCRRR